MLSQLNAIATVGVKDLSKAKDFYQNKLGLEPVPGEMEYEVQMYRCGNTLIELYHSEFAGSNKTTAISFKVGEELRKEVDNLKSKGVQFEHYDFPHLKMDGDIHVMGETKAAWFKDPDGNILTLMN